MAKKQRILKEEIRIREDIKPEELFELAKLKGYDAFGRLNSLSLIRDWLRITHHLHTEIFFSMFHKKWSLNNYILDLKTIKKIERPTKVIFYDEYNDAVGKAIDEMLQLI